jgi:hypothetical protein
MSRRFQLACYVADDVGRSFVKRAQERNLTTVSALRQLVVAYLYGGADSVEERSKLLFQTLALDALLQAKADPDLRQRVLQVLRERIVEEGFG